LKDEVLLRALGDLSNAVIHILADHDSPEPETVSTGEVLASWRERVWLVPDETRLGVRDVAEALSRSTSWVYKKASRAAGSRGLPCRKLEGELAFTAGELRAWIAKHEVIERSA